MESSHVYRISTTQSEVMAPRGEDTVEIYLLSKVWFQDLLSQTQKRNYELCSRGSCEETTLSSSNKKLYPWEKLRFHFQFYFPEVLVYKGFSCFWFWCIYCIQTPNSLCLWKLAFVILFLICTHATAKSGSQSQHRCRKKHNGQLWKPVQS